MPRGTWLFIAFPSPWSIRTLPRVSSISCCANGISTPTARSPPTNGTSATSIRRSSPGRPGAFTRSSSKQTGKGDRAFLETVFHKLLITFTWWVNRKDSEGKNIFQGGFLGLDNIGVFDRSASFPDGGHLEQSDGTSWMGMFCLNMMRIALELARENPVYENIATKFFEHFLGIAAAMNNLGGQGNRSLG